jgi:hypothetical protein
MNWQNGLGVIEYYEKLISITPVSIINGEAMFEGFQFAAKDYLPQLKEDTGYKF